MFSLPCIRDLKKKTPLVFCYFLEIKSLFNWLCQSSFSSKSPKLFHSTAVQLVFDPFSQFVPQLQLYSPLQLSLWSDPIAFSVPKWTWWVLVKLQGDGNLAETQMQKWQKFKHFFDF